MSGQTKLASGARKFLWFAGLWVFGVASVGAVGFVIRLWIA